MATHKNKADNPNILMEKLVRESLELHYQGKDKDTKYKYIFRRCTDDLSIDILCQSKQISDTAVDARVHVINEFDRRDPKGEDWFNRAKLRRALQINGQPPCSVNRETQASGRQPSTLRGPDGADIRPSIVMGKKATAQVKTSSA